MTTTKTTAPATFAHATMEIGGYTLNAYAATEEAAIRLLGQAAREWVKGYGETLRKDWRDWYCINTQMVSMGHAFVANGSDKAIV